MINIKKIYTRVLEEVKVLKNRKGLGKMYSENKRIEIEGGEDKK